MSKFSLGRCVATPGARSAIANTQEAPDTFLGRHQQG